MTWRRRHESNLDENMTPKTIISDAAEARHQAAQQRAASYLRRVCPACGTDAPEAEAVFSSAPKDFLAANPGWDRRALSELPLDWETPCRIVRCGTCRFVYAQHVLTDDALQLLYSQGVDHEHSRQKIRRWEKRITNLPVWFTLHELALHAQRKVVDLSVLDYGCGWGDFLLVATAPGVKAVGLEISPRKVAWAREQGATIETSEEAISQHTPFDLFYAQQVLEHLADPRESLEQIYQWVRPGGCGYVSVPFFSDQRILQIRRQWNAGPPPDKNIDAWQHLNYFSPDSLANMLQSVGFEVIGGSPGIMTQPSAGYADRSPLLAKLRWAWRKRRAARDLPPAIDPSTTTSLFVTKPASALLNAGDNQHYEVTTNSESRS